MLGHDRSIGVRKEINNRLRRYEEAIRNNDIGQQQFQKLMLYKGVDALERGKGNPLGSSLGIF